MDTDQGIEKERQLGGDGMHRARHNKKGTPRINAKYLEQKLKSAEVKKNNWKFKLGIVIMVVSVILFLSLPVIPFLPIDHKTKITISTVVFIIAEVTFYGGGFLVGKELFSKYKSYLNPKYWFKKKRVEKEESNA